MPKTTMLKCAHCHDWFYPDPYNAYQQEYCTKPPCRIASRRASREKWSANNPDYFKRKFELELWF